MNVGKTTKKILAICFLLEEKCDEISEYVHREMQVQKLSDHQAKTIKGLLYWLVNPVPVLYSFRQDSFRFASVHCYYTIRE